MNNGNRFHTGERVAILKAFDMETGRRTRVDEYAGCEAEVEAVLSDTEVRVWIDGKGKVDIKVGRLQPMSSAD